MIPEGIDGISILPALQGQPANNHEFLYWEFHERGFEQAIRMGKWKAVRHGLNHPIELYDLENDVSERHNVAMQHSNIVQRIANILQGKSLRTESPEFPVFSELELPHLALTKINLPDKVSA